MFKSAAKAIGRFFGFGDVPAAEPAVSTPVAVPVEKKLTSEEKKQVADFSAVAVGPTYGGVAAPWVENRSEFVKHYRGSTYIAIGAIARRVAQQKINIAYRRIKKSGETYEPVALDHPLVSLFKSVNPIYTEYDLWFHTIGWRMITGSSYWWKARNGFGVPAALWALPSHWVWAIPSETEFISKYLVQGVFGKDVEIPARDIIAIHEPNMDWSGSGRYYGMPVMKAGAAMVDIEEAMLNRLLYAFKNYAPPGLHYSTEQILEKDEFDALYRQIMAQHSRVQQSGMPLITHGGMTAKVPEGSNEMDYRDSLEVAMEYNLALYGVPKAVVGLVKDANRANMVGSLVAFCENTVNPLLVHIGQHLTAQLSVDFEQNLVCYFDPITIQEVDQIRKDVETAHKCRAITPNEVRDILLGLGPMKHGGENPIIPSSESEATFGNGEPVMPRPEPAEKKPSQVGDKGTGDDDDDDDGFDKMLKVDVDGKLVNDPASEEVAVSIFHSVGRKAAVGRRQKRSA